jgi:hypothetical protein
VLPAGTRSEAARDRLIREARAQARVHHPNVAHIYFIGEDGDRLYFAMEYLAGKTFADRLASGPLPVDDALDVIRAAVLGLREAHRSGFTHRDVKPSNLMVDAHGIVKVLDFGLVAANAGLDDDGPVEQTSLAGTPLYMAPEQARGEPIDLRADIYALGATLFHLISGKPPFVGETVAELVTQHASAARPTLPRGANKRVAVTAIDELIARMMAPAAADRFASYDELLRAIDLASSRHARPAGFWVRTFATGLDLIVATLLLAVVAIAMHGLTDQSWAVAVMFGAYTAIALRWRATTFGKSMFELEVVSTDTGERPRWPRVLVRQVSFVIPASMLALVSNYVVAPVSVAFKIAMAAWCALGFIDLAYAAWRRPGKRTLWDRVSHTQVRYRATRAQAGALLP